MINKVIIQGCVENKPELKTTKNGFNVCNFNLVCCRCLSEKEISIVVPVVAWGWLAKFIVEICSNSWFNGELMTVEGHLENVEATSRQGDKYNKLKLHAEQIYVY